MTILSIETSCDETSSSVLEKVDEKILVKSNITATSLEMHSATGGIIPENAARMQVKYIMPVIVKSLIQAFDQKEIDPKKDWENASKILKDNIDSISVTYGPGLIGSLLVGVETAKTLAYAFEKPLIPVNHLLAHIYANFITPELSLRGKTDEAIPTKIATPISKARNDDSFPFIGLIVSGGHTDLLHFESHDKFKWIGGTRDDAAGEAMDKIGRLLGIPYPAGPEIERRANLFSFSSQERVYPEGIRRAGVRFKSPMIGSDDFDFSFSGLKTEVLRFVQSDVILNSIQDPNEIPDQVRNDRENRINEVCFATQKAIIDVLVKKTLNAAKEFNCKTILVGGGVSANKTLMTELKIKAKNQKLNTKIFSPEKKYCTDNAAMIGAYALLNGETKPWQEVNANPELYFS